MSESEADQQSSSWETGWDYVKRYWHWPVLVVVGMYAYQQYMPSIDLSTMGGTGTGPRCPDAGRAPLPAP